LLSGCSSPKVPPPVDPTREQIVILQKQLLELQNAQNETRRKVDEQAATINSLSGRLRDAEVRQAALSSPSRLDQKQAANSQTAPAKKTVKSKGKKKKPVRRQEQ
jgi:type IV secretory pathway VirB10-like protein